MSKLILKIGTLAVLSVLLGCTGKDSVQAAKPQQAPAAPVIVATVTSRSMPVQLQAIGNVEAASTVSIKPQISGQLVGVHFKEGDFVKKGQLLFVIEPNVNVGSTHRQGRLVGILATAFGPRERPGPSEIQRTRHHNVPLIVLQP